jgi:hypothetical protein
MLINIVDTRQIHERAAANARFWCPNSSVLVLVPVVLTLSMNELTNDWSPPLWSAVRSGLLLLAGGLIRRRIKFWIIAAIYGLQRFWKITGGVRRVKVIVTFTKPSSHQSTYQPLGFIHSTLYCRLFAFEMPGRFHFFSPNLQLIVDGGIFENKCHSVEKPWTFLGLSFVTQSVFRKHHSQEPKTQWTML